jgi:GNAT superfamily N-acetyltransferase
MTAPAVPAFSAAKVEQYAEECMQIAHLGELAHTCQLAGGYTLRTYAIADLPDSLGPTLAWVVTRRSQLAGAGRFVRDLCGEEEDGQPPALIEQAAYFLPAHQRRGLYTQVLRRIRELAGIRIFPDCAQTSANAALWAKLYRELL